MDTESEFAPWDPSKAHILVSTPEIPAKVQPFTSYDCTQW